MSIIHFQIPYLFFKHWSIDYRKTRIFIKTSNGLKTTTRNNYWAALERPAFSLVSYFCGASTRLGSIYECYSYYYKFETYFELGNICYSSILVYDLNIHIVKRKFVLCTDHITLNLQVNISQQYNFPYFSLILCFKSLFSLCLVHEKQCICQVHTNMSIDSLCFYLRMR